MKRYNLVDSHAFGAGMDPHELGDWVKWDDASVEIEEHQKAIDNLQGVCEAYETRIKRQDIDIEQLRGKERAAYEAGFRDGWDCGNDSLPDIDIEQHWQQYRCQDPTGFRAETTKDSCQHTDQV